MGQTENTPLFVPSHSTILHPVFCSVFYVAKRQQLKSLDLSQKAEKRQQLKSLLLSV